MKLAVFQSATKGQRLLVVAGATILAVAVGLAGIWHLRTIAAASALKSRIAQADAISLMNSIAADNSLSGVMEEEIRELARTAAEGDKQNINTFRLAAVKAASRHLWLTEIETGALFMISLLFAAIAGFVARIEEPPVPPPVVLTLAKVLMRIRKVEGLSQQKLADKIGTDRNRIWRIENENGKPDAEILRFLEKGGWIRKVRADSLQDLFEVPQEYLLCTCKAD